MIKKDWINRMIQLIQFVLLFLLFTLAPQVNRILAQSANFDAYCKNGVYYIQKNGREISCGRAPNCDNRSYDSVNRIEWRSNAECWVEDYYNYSRCQAYCSGNVPLCCYKLAITKNSEECTWPERGYCLPSQCAGVGKRCGEAIETWCSSIDKCVRNVNDIPYIPLDQRLIGGNQAATPVPPSPTQQPTTQPTTYNPQPTVGPTSQPTTQPMTYNPQPTVGPTSQPISLPTTYNPQLTTRPITQPVSKPTDTVFCCDDFNTESFIPQQIIKKVINYENIAQIEKLTAPALDLPKKSFSKVIEADIYLENFFEKLARDILSSLPQFF